MATLSCPENRCPEMGCGFNAHPRRHNIAPWFRWLERLPVTQEIAGSSPVGAANMLRNSSGYDTSPGKRAVVERRLAGSTPALSAKSTIYASLAQPVEQRTLNPKVQGSNP